MWSDDDDDVGLRGRIFCVNIKVPTRVEQASFLPFT